MMLSISTGPMSMLEAPLLDGARDDDEGPSDPDTDAVRLLALSGTGAGLSAADILLLMMTC